MTRDGKPIDRAVISNFDFMRGVAGSSVLQAKVGDMCDIIVQESEIPAKPEYVPLEDSLFVGPAINTTTVSLSSRFPEEAHYAQRPAEALCAEALPLLEAQSVRFPFGRPAVPLDGRVLSFSRAAVTPIELSASAPHRHI